MAIDAHVAVVKGGRQTLAEWRALNPHVRLDLSKAAMSGLDLAECDFSEADLRGTVLTDCKLEKCIFSHSDLTGANLINCTMRWSVFANSLLDSCIFRDCDACDASFVNSQAHKTQFEGVNLSRSLFNKAKIHRGQLYNCHCVMTSFIETHLGSCSLVGVRMMYADISKCDFVESSIENGDWSHIKGAFKARGLETTKPSQTPNYFDLCCRTWCERYCDWESLRTFGRMPLFGISYTTLLLIPIYCFVISFYNQQLSRVSAYAATLDDKTGRLAGGSRVFSETVMAHLQPIPLPSLSLLLLGSTVLLAIASSIYTLACPSRIKEFTKDVWNAGVYIYHNSVYY